MRKILISSILLISLCGCAGRQQNLKSNLLTGDLIHSSYQIADTLLLNLKHSLSAADPIIVATFVNINNLKESSTFGRMVAEHISSRFSQLGFKVSELRLRTDTIFMEEGRGEFLLSRDLHSVSKKHNAAAVVVGTYGRANGGIYVSARIINPADSEVISSCDYMLKFYSDMDIALLMQGK